MRLFQQQQRNRTEVVSSQTADDDVPGSGFVPSEFGGAPILPPIRPIIPIGSSMPRPNPVPGVPNPSESTSEPQCNYWEDADGFKIFLSFNFAVMFVLPLIVSVHLLCVS